MIIWIFIGNFILFNLFISILIDSFNNKDVEDEEMPYEKSKNFPEVFKTLAIKQREHKKGNN